MRLQQPPADSADGVDDHLVSLVAPAAFEAEQYRALRHTIEQLHKAHDLRVVAVSSPGVGDGKSTTAINLAGALAQAPDARVLLVDADLRRPSVARLLALGASDGPGLVNAILDPRLTLEQVARPRPPFNLSVIQAGQTPPSPYEVLKSPRLGELLDEARRRYDYIVVDTPPLCPVQDCRVIAHWVDGFLLVVAAHRTPRGLVEEALNVVERGKMLGIVFNGDDHMPSGHSRYYGYYGGSRRPEPGHVQRPRQAGPCRDARRADAPAAARGPAVNIVLVEGTALFAAVAATVFVWGQPLLLDWLDVASLLGQAAIVSLCCIVAFYYNDLYDLQDRAELQPVRDPARPGLRRGPAAAGRLLHALPGHADRERRPALQRARHRRAPAAPPRRGLFHHAAPRLRRPRAHPGHGPAGPEAHRGDRGAAPLSATTSWAWPTTARPRRASP